MADAIYGLGMVADALAKALGGFPASSLATEIELPKHTEEVMKGLTSQQALRQAQMLEPFQIPLKKAEIGLKQAQAGHNIASQQKLQSEERRGAFKTEMDPKTGSYSTVGVEPTSETFGKPVAREVIPSPADVKTRVETEQLQGHAAKVKAYQDYRNALLATLPPGTQLSNNDEIELMHRAGLMEKPSDLSVQNAAELNTLRTENAAALAAYRDELLALKRENAAIKEQQRIPAILTRAEQETRAMLPINPATGFPDVPGKDNAEREENYKYYVEKRAMEIANQMGVEWNRPVPQMPMNEAFLRKQGLWSEPSSWNPFSTTPLSPQTAAVRGREEIQRINGELSRGLNIRESEMRRRLGKYLPPMAIDPIIKEWKARYGAKSEPKSKKVEPETFEPETTIPSGS